MMPYTPDPSPRTYCNEDDPEWDPICHASKSEASVETLYVCYDHRPPNYSKRKPIEVLLR